MAKKNRHKNPAALSRAAERHVRKRRSKQNGIGVKVTRVPRWRG